METILVLAHTEADGSLAKAALEALGRGAVVARHAGCRAGGRQRTAVPPTPSPVRAPASWALRAIRSRSRAMPRDAAAAEALCRAAGATLVLAPATSRWARVLPGVAHRLGGASTPTSRKFPPTAPARPSPAGTTASAWKAFSRAPGGRGSCCSNPAAKPRGRAPREARRWKRCRWTCPRRAPASPAYARRQADEQTIRPDAELLFVAGAGWTKKQADGKPHVEQAEALILGFLKQAQASLGGSKSLVDLSGEGQAVLHFMTHLNQIGQTGATPRHPKGLSTCCHGEEPHVVGWRFVNERRAVNLDPNCGWARGKADVLYVADAFAVMEKVNALLAARGR